MKLRTPHIINIVYKDKNDVELIDFRFVDDKVQRYMISTDMFHTAKGIRIGSSKAEVIDKYGDSYYTRKETGVYIMGYFDKENEMSIEFILTDGKVSTILVLKARGKFSITHSSEGNLKFY